MQFVYHELAGEQSLELSGEKFTHLFRSRRKKAQEGLKIRNLEDDFLYTYECIQINKKSAQLSLKNKKHLPKNISNLHLAWAVVDPKTIEKTLSFLNELGVNKLSFVYADFSQKHFKLDFQRMERILINSCEQCGRTKLMELEIYEDLNSFLQKNPQSFVLDFGGVRVEDAKSKKDEISPILVGCEGGFSLEEKDLFKQDKIIGLQSNLILRSETAIISLASKLCI